MVEEEARPGRAEQAAGVLAEDGHQEAQQVVPADGTGAPAGGEGDQQAVDDDAVLQLKDLGALPVAELGEPEVSETDEVVGVPAPARHLAEPRVRLHEPLGDHHRVHVGEQRVEVAVVAVPVAAAATVTVGRRAQWLGGRRQVVQTEVVAIGGRTRLLPSAPTLASRRRARHVGRAVVDRLEERRRAAAGGRLGRVARRGRRRADARVGRRVAAVHHHARRRRAQSTRTTTHAAIVVIARRVFLVTGPNRQPRDAYQFTEVLHATTHTTAPLSR